MYVSLKHPCKIDIYIGFLTWSIVWILWSNIVLYTWVMLLITNSECYLINYSWFTGAKVVREVNISTDSNYGEANPLSIFLNIWWVLPVIVTLRISWELFYSHLFSVDVYLTPLVIEDFHITHMTKKCKEMHIKFFHVNSFSIVEFLFFLTKI